MPSRDMPAHSSARIRSPAAIPRQHDHVRRGCNKHLPDSCEETEGKDRLQEVACHFQEWLYVPAYQSSGCPTSIGPMRLPYGASVREPEDLQRLPEKTLYAQVPINADRSL